MTSAAPIGAPLLGALLRMPVDVIRQRMLDALHARGLTDLIPAHLVVLRYPSPDGRRPVEIAAYSGFSKQALNPHLGQLEALGYLQRRDDPDDRRFKRVYLTARGQLAVQTMRDTVSAVELEWAGQLGAGDIETLREILTRLAVVLAPPANG
jgi:DNA-binding MarR family transcriptional regulator